MARVLVTGGAGYIGAHACKRLAAAGHEPIVFDNLRTGWRQAVRYGPLAEGDLLRPEDLDRAFAAHRPDAVMHFAALSVVGESQSQPALYWRNNVAGTLNLVEAMLRADVRQLVFSSTAAVYGEPDMALIPETASKQPTNTYGATKLAIEAMLADVERGNGLRAVVFRYFNVAGADPDRDIGEQHRPETHLVPLVLQAAAGERPAITIFGDDYATPDGTCVRDYVHVEDIAAAHALALEWLRDGGASQTLNLGTGRGYSVREVIDAAARVTGRDIPRTTGARRPGDPRQLVCDASRAGAVLGWRPRRSDIDTMVADAWAWHGGPGYAA